MKIVKCVLIGWLGVFGAFLSASDRPYDVTAGDFFDNPLGYNLESMSFSWKLPAVRNGIAQTAYQIVVADTKDALEKKPVVGLWESGVFAVGKSAIRRQGVEVAPKVLL